MYFKRIAPAGKSSNIVITNELFSNVLNMEAPNMVQYNTVYTDYIAWLSIGPQLSI